MKNIFKRIISLICAISLALVPVPAQAQEGAKISTGTASAYAGNSAYLSISGANFEKLAALDLAIYYDPEVLSVTSADTSGISDATVDVNYENPGEIKLSMASPKGISGNLTLLKIRFKANSAAKPGDYPVYVAIGDAFNTNLEAVSISRADGKFTVLKSSASVPTAYFYASVSDSSLEQGDETKITYYSYTLYNLASGVFEITYDKELFEFVEFGTYAAMQTADSVYSVNSDRAGIVKISYASSTAVKTGNLFYIKLRAIGDRDASTTVEMTPSSLFAQDLSPINASKRTSTINFTKKYVEPEPEDHPDFWVEVPGKVVEGLEFEATVKIAGESKAAAGDFTVKYNAEDFDCISVAAHSDVSEGGGMVVINKGFSNGEVKFSFVNENGISEDSGLVAIKLVPKKSGAYSSVIATAARGTVYDAKYNPVELDYIKTTVNVSEKSVTGIEIDSLPTKTVYTEGDGFDVTGGKIKVIYDNESFEIVDMKESMISGFDSSKTGEQTVTVSFSGFETSFDVMVNEWVYETGDINLDKKVDIMDVYYIRLIAAKLRKPTEQQILLGDVDLDGKITAIDANLIRKFAAKIIEKLPVEA